MEKVPNLSLNNGRKMPIIGLGTWQGGPGEVERAVEEALKIGYRHFDCALAYGNEGEIGNVLKKAIDGGQVTRDELFITTKLPPFANKPELVRKTLKTSMDRLKLDYIDLYLIHNAVSANLEEAAAQGMKSPMDKPPNPAKFFNKADHLGVWRELEKLVDEGLVKGIGLSNFNQQQIQNILDNSRIKPSNLQVECHAYLPQKELVEFCQKNGIVLTAYAPIGSPARFGGGHGGPVLLEEAMLKTIADRHQKTPAQILLNWLIQRKIGVLPKSVKPERLLENFSVLDFNLGKEDLADIEKIGERNLRFLDYEGWKDSPDYPFHN